MYYVDLLISGVAFGCLYAMATMGLTLVYGLLRILHIAHAALFTLGAFVGVWVFNASGSLIVGLIVAILAAVVMGCLIYRLIYESILSQPPYVPLLASLGVLIFLQDGFRIVFGEEGLTVRHNPFYMANFTIGAFSINVIYIVMAGGALISMAVLAFFANYSRHGIAWRATVSRPLLAANFGVNVIQVRYAAFAAGSALAAIAGVLVALMNNLVEPHSGELISYKGLAIIVLGGLGNMQGAFIASLVLGIAESFGIGLAGRYVDRDAIAAVALIATLMIFPNGIGRART